MPPKVTIEDMNRAALALLEPEGLALAEAAGELLVKFAEGIPSGYEVLLEVKKPRNRDRRIETDLVIRREGRGQVDFRLVSDGADFKLWPLHATADPYVIPESWRDY